MIHRMAPFAYRLPQNIVAVFKPRNLIWHGLVIALSFVAVVTGFDWWYFQETRSALLFQLAIPAALLGFAVPVFTPFVLLTAKTRQLQNAGYALGQSAVLAWMLSALYKVFTGRMHPPLVNNASTLSDISRDFHFGFMNGGVFWGWPSSHTTVAFAIAFTAITLFPRPKVRFWALAFALYVGVGVSITIHWFSDFAAGAILGTLVGTIVGEAFRNRE